MAKHSKMHLPNARECPECGSDQVTVYYTGDKRFGLMRRRRCLDCGHRYKTIEVHMDMLEGVYIDDQD